MTEKDITYLIGFLEKLDATVKEGASATQEVISELSIDVAVIKGTLNDIKNVVFGNGKEGLISKVQNIDNKVCNMKEKTDDITTNDIILHTTVRKLEEKIWKWTGIVLGINLTIGIVFTIVVNLLHHV